MQRLLQDHLKLEHWPLTDPLSPQNNSAKVTLFLKLSASLQIEDIIRADKQLHPITVIAATGHPADHDREKVDPNLDLNIDIL